MSSAFSAFEREALPELGAAHEHHELHEMEGEYEGEAFLGTLGRIGMAAARSALGALTDGEMAHEYETEGEWEAELNPVRKVYPDAMMEHLAHQAMQAETEAEAGEAFLPLIPLVAAKLLPLAAKALPLAAKALPKIMSTVNKVAPHLMRGVSRVARTLFRNPRTRPLLRSVPSIVQRTVGTIARQAARGQPITPQAAVRTLARQTAGFLRSPQRNVQALRRSRALDRQFHRAAGVIGVAPGPCPVCPSCGIAPAPARPAPAACPTCGRPFARRVRRT